VPRGAALDLEIMVLPPNYQVHLGGLRGFSGKRILREVVDPNLINSHDDITHFQAGIAHKFVLLLDNCTIRRRRAGTLKSDLLQAFGEKLSHPGLKFVVVAAISCFGFVTSDKGHEIVRALITFFEFEKIFPRLSVFTE